MNDKLLQLAARIRDELLDLERVVGRVTEGWRRAQRSADDYYLDGVALNLHGFYAGLERIFELVATTVDRTKPEGENWHQALLLQMATEKPAVRPAVISESACRQLDEYRGFRHVVRNVYTFKFDPTKVGKLVDDIARGTIAGTKIGHFCHVMAGARIGERCILGQNVLVANDVVIGNNVKIQNNVSLYTGVELEDDVFCGPSCVFTNVTNPGSQILRHSQYQRTLVRRGANATIVCGATIGCYAFIGAGALRANAGSAGAPAGMDEPPRVPLAETGRRW